jgi:hypothetical protein
MRLEFGMRTSDDPGQPGGHTQLEFKVAAGEVGPGFPIAPGEVGKQLDVTDDAEAKPVKEAKRSCVPSNRSCAQEADARRLRMSDDRLRELQADAATPICLADYDRLQLGLSITRDHARKADDSVARHGNPQVPGTDALQVLIELQAGVLPPPMPGLP